MKPDIEPNECRKLPKGTRNMKQNECRKLFWIPGRKFRYKNQMNARNYGEAVGEI